MPWTPQQTRGTLLPGVDGCAVLCNGKRRAPAFSDPPQIVSDRNSDVVPRLGERVQLSTGIKKAEISPFLKRSNPVDSVWTQSGLSLDSVDSELLSRKGCSNLVCKDGGTVS